MRTLTVTLCTYDELPTEVAKAKAREWWAELEAADPAWLDEHSASMRAADRFCREYSHPLELKAEAVRLLKETDGCPWTGYCADHDALEYIADACNTYDTIPEIARRVQTRLAVQWDRELEDRLSDDDGIADSIIANGYEFHENGSLA